MVYLDEIWLNPANLLVDLIKFCMNQPKIMIHSIKWFD